MWGQEGVSNGGRCDQLVVRYGVLPLACQLVGSLGLSPPLSHVLTPTPLSLTSPRPPPAPTGPRELLINAFQITFHEHCCTPTVGGPFNRNLGKKSEVILEKKRSAVAAFSTLLSTCWSTYGVSNEMELQISSILTSK